jgi:CRP-like cAMP-binding protein
MKAIWDNLFHKSAGETQAFDILKDSILFKDLNMNELEIVYKIMNPRNFRAGEVIFKQGDCGVGMYIIISGTVSIFLEEVLENQEIRRNFITKLSRGDFFGESSLVIENGNRSASVIAKEDCQLLSFFYPELREIITRYPKAGNKILMRLGEVLGTRLRESNKKIISLISEVETLKKELHKDSDKNDTSSKQIYST